MKIQSIFNGLNISASGLSAQRKKLDAIASNIANVNTTRTENGEPYRRRFVVMEEEKMPAFETVLKQKRLSLKTTHEVHFPFKKEVRSFKSTQQGVKANVKQDMSDFRQVYDPTHPDADENGYVSMPNINMVSEMVDMINASRSYEANLSSIEAAKKMADRALEI